MSPLYRNNQFIDLGAPQIVRAYRNNQLVYQRVVDDFPPYGSTEPSTPGITPANILQSEALVSIMNPINTVVIS
jgi:hypothetical protein